MSDFLDSLQNFSDNYMNDTQRWYYENPPCQKNQLVDVYTPDARLYAIGKVVGLTWDKWLGWLVDVEIMGKDGLEIIRVNGGNISRHVGFRGRVA